MGEETKNECGYTWGTALALLGGAAVGYWAGRSNGNCGCNNGCGCGHAVAPVAGGAYAAGNLGYLEGKVQGIADAQNYQIRYAADMQGLDATLSTYNALNEKMSTMSRDMAGIAFSQMRDDFANFRNIDNQICTLSTEMINQNAATRAEIAAFRSEYNRDRADDFKTKWQQAENRLANVPLEIGLNTVTQKLDCVESAFSGRAVRSVPFCNPSTTYNYSPCGCNGL